MHFGLFDTYGNIIKTDNFSKLNIEFDIDNEIYSFQNSISGASNIIANKGIYTVKDVSIVSTPNST